MKISSFFTSVSVVFVLFGAVSCRNNVQTATIQDFCRFQIAVPDNLEQKDSGIVYLCNHLQIIDTLGLKDTVLFLPADSTVCYSLIWEFPGIDARRDRYFAQFVPEGGMVSVDLDNAAVSGGRLNTKLTLFAKQVSDAFKDYDSDYARDLCADTFRGNPRNAVGLQALYFCLGDYRPDEIETMMKEAGLSRKERENLMENPIIKGFFAQKAR